MSIDVGTMRKSIFIMMVVALLLVTLAACQQAPVNDAGTVAVYYDMDVNSPVVATLPAGEPVSVLETFPSPFENVSWGKVAVGSEYGYVIVNE